MAARGALADALAVLGKERFALAIHGVSFPSDPGEDVGVGAPGTAASDRLLAFARALGVTGIQLGPEGETSPGNPSPYDGTAFSRGLTSLPLRAFAPDGPLAGLVSPASVAAAAGHRGARADHRRAHGAVRALLDEAWTTFRARRDRFVELDARLERFSAAHATWLRLDAEQAEVTPDAWTGGSADGYAFGQLLAHEEHARVRDRARALGLALHADLQVGFSVGDARAQRAAFLPGYLLGAPPSRTNPEGQPWGYPVLDPEAPAALALVRARADKTFAEYDALRVDHPHGLVCPWVYRDEGGDPRAAVRAGARLFESPDLPDHPLLARHARVRPDQLDRSLPRYADGWVRDLTAEQVDRYALFVDLLVEAAERHGRCRADLSCEALSTLPAPLARVLRRHGLGRWRILQKANLDDPADVYRAEHATPEDWVMLGNHDTSSIWATTSGWDAPRRAAWARHATLRLGLPETAGSHLAERRGLLANVMFAELLASAASNVLVFFADLFGVTERFNVPGVVSPDNWTVRLPGAFEALHAARVRGAEALDVAAALALALRARSASPELASALWARAAIAPELLRPLEHVSPSPSGAAADRA